MVFHSNDVEFLTIGSPLPSCDLEAPDHPEHSVAPARHCCCSGGSRRGGFLLLLLLLRFAPFSGGIRLRLLLLLLLLDRQRPYRSESQVDVELLPGRSLGLHEDAECARRPQAGQDQGCQALGHAQLGDPGGQPHVDQAPRLR